MHTRFTAYGGLEPRPRAGARPPRVELASPSSQVLEDWSNPGREPRCQPSSDPIYNSRQSLRWKSIRLGHPTAVLGAYLATTRARQRSLVVSFQHVCHEQLISPI